MADLIDKQEVINALNDLARNENLTTYPSLFNHSPYYLGAIHDVYEKIKGLPTTTEPEKILCKECRYYIPHGKRCGFWNHGVKPLEWCCHAERKE